MTNSLESDLFIADKTIRHDKIIHNKDKENRIEAYAGPEQIVYEGSSVLLEGYSYPPKQKLFWKQIDGPTVKLEYKNKDTPNEKSQNPQFTAPYVNLDIADSETERRNDNNNHNKPYVELKFELIAKNLSETLSSPPSTINIIVKMVQRALIFQGGGSLGAYEAGVFSALCDHLIEKDIKTEGKRNRSVFDIIAGSSIGAVNAAIIVGNIKKRIENNTNEKNNSQGGKIASIWKDTTNELDRFWNEISYSTWWLDNDLFNMWWNSWNKISKEIIQNYKSFLKDNSKFFEWKNQIPLSQLNFYMPENMTPVASGEAARRYFSWIHFLYSGVPNVMTANFSQPDTKFFLGIPSFARFDNAPLKKTIKKYWDYENYPLKTEFEKGEPRLLLVCVDVMDATSAVTFDSYLCETKYPDGKSVDEKINGAQEDNFNYIIKYPEGISIDHVSASMSPHLKYQYPNFQAYSERENNFIDRYFWDGAYLSNTPLRELIQLHRDYWYEEGKEEKKHVPHLEVYIVNLYPAVEKENELPSDADTIQDREVDIRFHDRTQYDVKVAQMISDYVILHGQVKNLAIKHLEKFGQNESKDFLDDLKNLLDKKTKSKKRGSVVNGKKKIKDDSNEGIEENKSKFISNRKYKDLFEGRFDLAKVIYIDRKDDGNTVFGKAAEFSTKTINKLKDDGYKEALKEIEKGI
jgi:NTE family protein